MQPHRRQPTRLPCPWDSPGKNTGVGCHFLLQSRKVKSESEVAQSCPTLSDPMDCSLPGSSIHGIFQARVLEWGAIAIYIPPKYQHLFVSTLLAFEWEGVNGKTCWITIEIQCLVDFLAESRFSDIYSVNEKVIYCNPKN